MSIRLIIAADWLEQARELAMQHWAEVAKDRGLPKPNINPQTVAELERLGVLFALGAFDRDGVLVGYSLNIVGPTLNFSHLRCCQNEGLFVDKANRGRLAVRLIQATEEQAARLSCNQILWHTYTRTRADALFQRIGYADHDHIWSKELTPCQPA